ncbi:TPA: hypothetical protein ACF1RY_001875, partial [Enterococcus hirae]
FFLIYNKTYRKSIRRKTDVEIKKMLEDLNRIWKKTGILKRRGAKLRNMWKRNRAKIGRLWKKNRAKIKRMRSKNLKERKDNDKEKRIKMAQSRWSKQDRTGNKQEIRSLSVRATNQASWKNAQISRNLANQQKGYSRSQQTSITSTR